MLFERVGGVALLLIPYPCQEGVFFLRNVLDYLKHASDGVLGLGYLFKMLARA